MTGGVDEVETAVYAIVDNVPSIQATLVFQVLLKLVVYVLYDLTEAGQTKQKPQLYSHILRLG